MLLQFVQMPVNKIVRTPSRQIASNKDDYKILFAHKRKSIIYVKLERMQQTCNLERHENYKKIDKKRANKYNKNHNLVSQFRLNPMLCIVNILL